MIRRATIISVGKVKGWQKDGCDDYLKRLKKYFTVEVVEVPESDMNRMSPGEAMSSEWERLVKKVPQGAYVVALDRDRGKLFSSEEIAHKRLAPLGESGRSHVVFIVGGALGLSDDAKSGADEVWSFGGITYPHGLARVVLLEQLYRAVKIHRGEPYHW